MNPTLYPEWYFAQRHAMVCMFAFFLALLLLLAQEGKRLPWKALGVLCLGVSAVLGVRSIHAQAFEVAGKRAPGPSAFVKWLNDESAKRGGMTVAMRQPQPIAYQTHDVGFHWYYAHTNLNDLRVMVKLGAVYLIVPGKQSFSFSRSPDFEASFHLVQTIEGNRIYAPDPSLLPAPAAP
jgi:hypothetical protein